MTDHEFHLFSRLPCELRLLIWERYLSDYQDSCGVLWDLKWGVDDSPASRAAIRQRFGEESEGHIPIRPFIDLGCQHEDLVLTSKFFEVNCNPLLKVNIEARKAATANDRYVSVPVWSRDINIIVRPALDLFRIEGALVELFLWPDVAGDIPQPPRSLDDIVVKSLVLIHPPTFARRGSHITPTALRRHP
ncbi:hypothetical protein B0H65DRAFT_155316 [Neurospora tetraspora]|uniref:2EXR domain-containing protein n=1 Tax=Neurospora tetraspora TaxID=94610 RepID=A0AAE0JIC0_9PEZI|nr:hypothetical protein B0H65DRAFT_155316 [Neurospora tetraspora]